MKGKKILRDTIIIVAISLALLGVSEIILRIIFPEKIKIARVLAYEFNKEYLVSLKPNIEKIFVRSPENGGNIINWNTNKDSFRGDDLKEAAQIRIIVYGDSNIQARFSKRENTFVYKLENYLQKTGIKNIEVVNAGIAGFGPDQSLIRFTKEADIYDPDVVIFHIYADNDFGDIIRNRLFELDSSGNLVAVEHEKLIDKKLLKDQQLRVSRIVSSSLINRAVLKMFRIITQKDKKEDRREKIITGLIDETEREYSVYRQSQPRYFSHFADHYDVDIALFPDAESSKTKIKLMDAVLKRAKSLANSKGIELLVLIQPSVIDLTKNFKISYDYLQKYSGYRRTNLTAAVEKICIANKINFVNLFNVFTRNNPENLFFKVNDNHWNDQGQDIAAKETALYINRRIIPNGYRLTNRFGE